MTRSSRWGRLAATSMAAGLTLASLGSTVAAASPSASQLLHESVAALEHAPTLTFRGYVLQGKGTSRIQLLVRTTDHGREADGHLAFGPAKGAPTQTVAFVRLGSAVYFDANQHFWAANAGKPPMPKPVLKVLGGHWVRLPAKDALSGIASFTNPASIAKGFMGGVTGALHLGPLTKVNGVRARSIVQGTSTLDVAAAGKPLPLEALDRSKGSGGAIVFGYPKVLHVKAPRGAITVAQAVKEAANQAG